MYIKRAAFLVRLSDKISVVDGKTRRQAAYFMEPHWPMLKHVPAFWILNETKYQFSAAGLNSNSTHVERVNPFIQLIYANTFYIFSPFLTIRNHLFRQLEIEFPSTEKTAVLNLSETSSPRILGGTPTVKSGHLCPVYLRCVECPHPRVPCEKQPMFRRGFGLSSAALMPKAYKISPRITIGDNDTKQPRRTEFEC